MTSLIFQLSDHSGKLLEVERELEMETVKLAELSREEDSLQQHPSSSELQGLRVEIKREQDKIVQLWHDNCQQLLDHLSEMFEKEKEIQLLCDRLRRTAMELTT